MDLCWQSNVSAFSYAPLYTDINTSQWIVILACDFPKKQCQVSFSWAPQSMRTLTTAIKLKDACSLEKSYNKHQLSRSVVYDCDPMDCSTPGFPVHHQFPESTKTHLHWVGDAIQTISPSVVPFSSCLQSFPASGSFQMSQLFSSGGQSIGVSAAASVLLMNIQDWFPLGLAGLICLQSKGLSRVFSNNTVQKL